MYEMKVREKGKGEGREKEKGEEKREGKSHLCFLQVVTL